MRRDQPEHAIRTACQIIGRHEGYLMEGGAVEFSRSRNSTGSASTVTISGLAGPVSIALNRAGTTGWVSLLNAGNGSVAVIDTASDTVTGTIPASSSRSGSR